MTEVYRTTFKLIYACFTTVKLYFCLERLLSANIVNYYRFPSSIIIFNRFYFHVTY